MSGQAVKKSGLVLAAGLAFAAGMVAENRLHLLAGGLRYGLSVLSPVGGLLGKYLHLAAGLAVCSSGGMRRKSSLEVRGP